MKNLAGLIGLLLILCVVSCKKSKTLDGNEVLTVCWVNNPLKNIGWLKTEYEKIASQPKTNGIILYSYNNKEVLEIQNAQFSSTNQHQYYCDGTKLDLNAPSDFNKFKQERKLIGILYGTDIWD